MEEFCGLPEPNDLTYINNKLNQTDRICPDVKGHNNFIGDS